jgi:hypothetical protein
MFLKAVQIMLSNVRAERERDWSAHLMSFISLQSCLLHFSCEVLLVHVIPALSFIALLSDAMKCLDSALSVVQFVSFYSPISKSQLKPFEHMNAKTSLKYKSGEIITGHINPEIVFRRALVLAKLFASFFM